MVIRDIYNNLPSWAMLFGIAFFFMGVAALIYWILRHFFPNFTERGNLQAHSILVGILASTYGIMLGFIIVILWQAFTQVQATVALEANEVALIIADSYAFPAEIRNKIMGGAADYVKSVRFYEWETMREGKASPKTVLALRNLLEVMLSFEPTTHNQKVFYEEIIKHLNNTVAYRRQRISAATSALPATLRTIIVISAILIIIFICVLQSQRKKPDILKILLVTGVMASYVGLVFVLDYPFSGDIAVNDEAFSQGILEHFKLE